MNVLLTAAEAGQEALPTVSTASITEILALIKASVTGVLDIASAGFNFLLSTPLSAFMIGSGFAFTALSLVRKGLRVSKRT